MRDSLRQGVTVTSMTSSVFSLGYEGRSLTDVLDLLVEHEVSVLVDVRLTPLSRRPGLSKTRLRAALAEVGVSYVHLRALGNPRENRPSFREGRVQAGCAVFAQLLETPAGLQAMSQLQGMVASGRVAVLCFERDHGACHRQVVLAHLTGASVVRL